MAQYIKKSALTAELNKRLQERKSIKPSKEDDFGKGYLWGRDTEDKAVLYFIDTLEVKDVDFEEKATQLSQKYFPDEENIWARANIEALKCKSACMEMAEWLKAQKGE